MVYGCEVFYVRLNIWHIQLGTIPSSIGSLISLTSLQLNNNKYTGIYIYSLKLSKISL